MALTATTKTYSGSSNSRRKSAASISVIIENNNNRNNNNNLFLSPNSVFPQNNFRSEHRRNSYAGDNNKIPELFIYSPEIIATTMSQTLASGGTQQFLTPMGSFRRKLPPTPLDLENGRLSGSQDALLIPPSEDIIILNNNNNINRRTSSPRVLPTPPSPQQQYSPNSTRGSQNSPMNYNDDNNNNNNIIQQLPPTSPFERRRSVRRQLPPEPKNILFEQPQLINNNFCEQKQPNLLIENNNNNIIEGIATLKIIENNNNSLQRSYSTKSSRKLKKEIENEENRTTNTSPNLPKSPNRQKSLEQQFQQNNNISSELINNNNNLIINNQQPLLLKTPSSNNALNSPSNTNIMHGRTLSTRKIKEETTEMPQQHQRLSLTEQTTESSLQLYPTIRPVASSLGSNSMMTGGPKIIKFSKPKLTLNNNKREEEDLENEEDNNLIIINKINNNSRPSLTSTNSSISPSIITPNSALIPPSPSQAFFAISAPSSPRELYSSSSNCSSSRKYSASSGSACSSADSTSHPQQSAVLTDLAAISALNSRCNRSGPGTGSMAHLLEQQHILKREFTSASIPLNQQQLINGINNNNILNKSQSNSSSSLSPSMEQLNCNTTVAGSCSGSDVEISAADPSVLGFDPSLYVNGINNQNAQSSPIHTLNSNGAIPSTSTNGDFHKQPRPKGLGFLHCTLQHFPVRKRLRVNVLKIEGLAGELRPDLEIQPFCKLTLTSTKKQQSQQQQSVIKRGRDAVFNQEFFFDNFATEEIELKQLQIEVCHSSNQKLQRDLDIGEVRIPLIDLAPQLQTKKEVRIVEELKIFVATKKLGKLHITTCIEKADRRLTINLIKVEDLPKWGIIGAPDVQIRIRMQQANNPEVIKCSRIIKNTTSAVYKEAVMFLVSTREADLARTKITISVHDLSRSVTGNDTIGFVFLGELASDKSEIDQWRSTMDHWGKEYKAVHTLKCPSSRCQPSLHVLDVNDENDAKENDE